MITLTEKREIEKSGEFGEERGFQIKNTAKAFKLLIGNLYSDKVGAVVREISANAADAHISVKNQSPFEVCLPSRFEPVLTVRDFGCSMSHDFMIIGFYY